MSDTRGDVGRRLLARAPVACLLVLGIFTAPVPATSARSTVTAVQAAADHAENRLKHKHGRKSHPSISIPGRPKPREESYKGCPPWGHAGDPMTNLLKNRIDIAKHPHAFTAKQFLQLPWPRILSRKGLPMEKWTRAEKHQAFRYEGMAASVEGYLVAFNRLGPSEPCNCFGKGGYDWHFWIATTYRASRRASIIAEATPRVRARENGFNWKTFATLAGKASKVRVTGWIFLDNDHKLGETDRATLWEIHPITRIDVRTKHGWKRVAG